MENPFRKFAQTSICWFVVLAVCMAGLPMGAAAQPVTESVIRVCYPLQYGLTQMDSQGNFSGYTYEYLMKIAQRTGWKYEFYVTGATNSELEDGLEKVKSGELDLITMVYSEALAEQYEFTSVPFGEAEFVLLAKENNAAVNRRTVYDLPELKVALVEKAKIQNGLFEEFCQKKGLVYQPVYAANNDECLSLVESGQADVLISKDVIAEEGYKTVLQFATQPFYFAVTKGNQELAQELSRLIMEINNADPYYQLNLHEKYFKKDSDYQLALTAAELEYLKNASPIRTLVLTGRAPIQDLDDRTGEFSGIVIDILKKISEESGLPLALIQVDSMEEARRLLAENQADILAGIPYHYPTGEAYNVLLTSPIFTMPIVRIDHKQGGLEQGKTLVSSSIKLFENQAEVQYVEEIGEIFRLIDRGSYQTAYVNGYMAQRYLEKENYPNIIITPTPYSNYELCIGVRQNADLRLMSILEQSISNIRPTEIEDIVYRNTAQPRDYSLWDVIKKNPLLFSLPVIGIFSIIIVLLLILFIKTRRMNKMILEEKSRYQMISTFDRLTQTYNNETFKQLTKEYLSGAEGVPSGAFLVCDIDDFKSVNDTYGHLVGDEVIRAFGELLNTMFADRGIVGRIGGDEFVVLVKEGNKREKIAGLCEETIAKCRENSNLYKSTVSIGAALFSGNASFDRLFTQADDALYHVKKKNKDGFEIVSYLG